MFKLIAIIMIKNYEKCIVFCNYYTKKISMEILKFKNCIVNALGTSPPLPPECDALKET